MTVLRVATYNIHKGVQGIGPARREVFGGAHLLGKLFLPGSSTGIPAYLPDALAKKLPLYRRFRVRMIAEAHPQADQYEESSAALRPLALARVLAPR